MTLTQSQRLALIRADMAKWAVLRDTREWDVVFLLKVVDEKNEIIKNLEKEKL